MKKFLVVLVVFVLLIAGAAAVFILTFDADRYRPLIVDQVQKAINKPVEVRKISLGWHGRLSLDIDGLIIKAGQNSPNELIRLNSAKALVEFYPLLQKKLQVTSIILEKPVVTLVKLPRGIDGFLPDAAPAPITQEAKISPVDAAAALPAASVDPSTFLIDQIKIRDGELIFRDETKSVPSEIYIRDIQSTLNDVALNRPVTFKILGALLSRRQNLQVEGVFENHNGISSISGIKGSLDLAAVVQEDWNKLLASPNGAAVPFPGGELTFQIPSVSLDENAARNLQAEADYRGGKIVLIENPNEIQNIQASAVVKDGRVEVPRFSADFASGQIQGAGGFNFSLPEPLLTFQASAQNLSLAQLAPARSQQEPQIEGNLSLSLQGTGRGMGGDQISRTLAGKGELLMDQAVIRNLNILREVFSKFSMIPGLVRKLEEHLPADYQEKLAARDTVLNPVQAPFIIEQGVVTVPRLDVSTDSIQIVGSGQAGLDGRVNFPLLLFIEPELSNALIHSVNEFQALADTDGRLQVPVILQGIAPNITPVVDLQYIASKLAVAKTRELLAGMVQKKSDPNAVGGTTTGQSLPGSTGQGLGGNLQPLDSQQGTSQQPQSSGKPPKFKDLLAGFLEANTQDNNSTPTN